MALNWQSVTNKNLGGGIDSYSARTNIQEGYSEVVENADTKGSGKLAKRTGYVGYYGWVPFRVRRIDHIGTTIRLTIDNSTSLNFDNVGATPLVVAGTLPSEDAPGGGYAGDFSTTFNSAYYATSSVANRDIIPAGASTLTKTSGAHGITDTFLIFTGMAEATSLSNSSNTHLTPESFEIDEATKEMSIGLFMADTTDTYFFYKNKKAEAGVTYVHTVSASSTSVSIPTATHALDNFNIGVRCFESDGSGTTTAVEPESVTIALNGDVDVEFGSPIGAGSTTGYIVLTACPADNVASFTASAGLNTVVVSGAPSSTCFYYCYAFSTALNKWEAVTPQAIVYDALTDTTTIEWLLAAGFETCEVYYEEAETIANVLEITDTGAVSETYTSLTPQLTVWGIPHEGSYKTSLQGGHVTHIDNFKNAIGEKLVCGLGGNLFEARPNTTSSQSLYKMGQGDIALRERVLSDSFTSPLFYNVAGSTRTRGIIVDASIDNTTNTALCTAVSYVSDGVADYTLSFTDKTGYAIADGGVIDAEHDYLTISDMANNDNNGEFKILSIQSDSATETIVRVANAKALSVINDETGSAGRAGVFTDAIEMEDDSLWTAGDEIVGGSSGSLGLILSVKGTDGSTVYVGGVKEEIGFATGLVLYVRRKNTDVIPLRLRDSMAASVVNFVAGDMCQYNNDVGGELRVLGVNVHANKTASITGNGTTATFSWGSEHGLNVGTKLLLVNAGEYSGVVEIAEVPTLSTFTFASSLNGTITGTIVGATLHIDAEIDIEDNTLPKTFYVVGRWTPIEAPSYTTHAGQTALPKETYVHHFTSFDYDKQPILRSTMMGDGMYFVNAFDEVMKYDGRNILRASLPRWQPMLYSQISTSPASLRGGLKIPYTLDSGSVNGKYFLVDGAAFLVGDRVYDNNTDRVFTVTSVTEDSTGNTRIVVGGDQTSDLVGTGTPTLTLVKTRRYYARLNYIDANDNIVATAATGANDMLVEQTVTGAINLKLVGLPAYDVYDYDRIELELYRTRDTGSPPFYLVSRQILSFDSEQGYVDIVDTVPDELLFDTDAVHSSRIGVELGSAWNQLPRAKYITSLDNRLILANTKSTPQFDIVLQPPRGFRSIDDLSGVRLLFRKDNTDTLTTTNMDDRVGVEFITSGANNIASLTATYDFTTEGYLTVGKTSHGLDVGDWVYFFHDALGTNNDLTFCGHHQVKSVVNSGRFELPIKTEVVEKTGVTFTTDSTLLVVNLTAHGLEAGDMIKFREGVGGTLPANVTVSPARWYVKTVTSANTFTIASTPTGTALGHVSSDVGSGALILDYYFRNLLAQANHWVTATAPADIPVWMNTDGNYNHRFTNVDSTVATTASWGYVASLRLSNAINSAMRQTRAPYEPWLLAGGGNDYDNGQVNVETPLALPTTPELKLSSLTDNVDVYVHGIKRSDDEEIGARTYLFPSRVCMSYRNYPEVVDAPYAPQLFSDSVVDINASDGQEITGVIPFFSESAFGGAQLNQTLIVFKTNSIYVLDTSTRDYQKLDSRGMGCTAPFSIAATNNGIIFANDSGIYRLNRNLTITHVGKFFQGLWDDNDEVKKSLLEQATATHYALERRYKLSYPTITDAVIPTKVAVYNHDRDEMEGGGLGSWTTYSSHPSKGWASQGANSFFASKDGHVYRVRNDGISRDYRDDAAPISTTLKLKPEDFGMPNLRKSVRYITSHFEYSNISNLSIGALLNLKTADADEIDAGSITSTNEESYVARSSFSGHKASFLQPVYKHDKIDEGFTLAGISYTVALLDGAARGTRTTKDRS